jgi:hypothetical protein
LELRSAGGFDAGEGLGAVADGLVPGDAHDALAGGLEEGLAFGVVLAGEAIVVPFGSIGFDYEALGRPAEVGDDAAAVDSEGDVDVGWDEPGAEDEVEHGVLELAARWGGAGGEDGRELAGGSWDQGVDVHES